MSWLAQPSVSGLPCKPGAKNGGKISGSRYLSLGNNCVCVLPMGPKNLPHKASEKLMRGRLKKDEKWLLEWILGLTDKGMQNVLRDDTSGLEQYTRNYVEITKKAVEEFEKDYGVISGSISLSPQEKAQLNWDFII